ncbi:4'-phosphopantetheinyl transferase family protein [Lacrimispora sp. JR3]|uniref:4'-phosphopantetheinyl transferase family protein n=1 Tax=Lacrimispora sinapis TaxID=3111456 RepID=UPI0037478E21
MYGLLNLIGLGAVTLLKENVYLADLDRCRKVSEIHYEDYLSDEEKKRLNLIRMPRPQNRMMLRRSLTRLILSGVLDCSPNEIRFSRNSYGKPFILEPVTDMKFNLSHSGEYLILIADRTREVGIDIETAQSFRKRTYEALKVLYSPEEFTYYQRLSRQEQYQMFCRTWVMKEAVTKALSVGLTVDLGTISLPLGLTLPGAILTLDVFHALLKIQWITVEEKQIGIAYREGAL